MERLNNLLDPHNPGPYDRVRRRSSPVVNRRVDEQIHRNLRSFSLKSDLDIDGRIQQLELQWDVDRAVEALLGGTALMGLLFGTSRAKMWLLLSGLSSLFLIQFAASGWCLPLSLLRRLGFRTRREIDTELYGLRSLCAGVRAAPVSCADRSPLAGEEG